VGDFQNGYMDTISLNDAGTAIKVKNRVFTSMHFDRPVDIEMGPDGAMYVINYAGWFGPASTTGIVRIDYTGSCRPELATSIARVERAVVRGSGMKVEIDGAEGRYELAIADLRGRTLATFTGSGAASYDVAAAVGHRAGLYVARLATSAGLFSRTVVLGSR
jgi:hypothetical protein